MVSGYFLIDLTISGASRLCRRISILFRHRKSIQCIYYLIRKVLIRVPVPKDYNCKICLSSLNFLRLYLQNNAIKINININSKQSYQLTFGIYIDKKSHQLIEKERKTHQLKAPHPKPTSLETIMGVYFFV